jgi:hypothetical protein
MDLREHALMMGKLLVSFHCLEYALRAFLYERCDPPHKPLAPGTNLDTMTFGEVVTENAITRWDSLTYLISRYNRTVGDGQLKVDHSLVELRDALAHAEELLQELGSLGLQSCEIVRHRGSPLCIVSSLHV